MSIIGQSRKSFSVTAYNKQKREALKKRCATCPHCEYDRKFPGFERGGWMQQENNGPIVSCPMCNPAGVFRAN